MKLYNYTIKRYKNNKVLEVTQKQLTEDEVRTTIKNLNSYSDYSYRLTTFDYYLGIALPDTYTTRHGEYKTTFKIEEV